MSGEINVSPGYTFNQQNGEALTLDKLQSLVNDMVLQVVQGAITSRELADRSVTADKLDTDISAQLGVANGSVTLAKLAAGFVLPVTKGGTGATTVAAARSALDVDAAEQYALFRDDRASGVSGQYAGVGWSKRTLVEVINGIDGVSIASDIITLPAGTYRVCGWGICHAAEYGNYNTTICIFEGSTATSGAALVVGHNLSTWADDAGGRTLISQVVGQFTLALDSTIMMCQYCNKVGSLGTPIALAGFGETYAALEIWKIA